MYVCVCVCIYECMCVYVYLCKDVCLHRVHNLVPSLLMQFRLSGMSMYVYVSVNMGPFHHAIPHTKRHQKLRSMMVKVKAKIIICDLGRI